MMTIGAGCLAQLITVRVGVELVPFDDFISQSTLNVSLKNYIHFRQKYPPKKLLHSAPHARKKRTLPTKLSKQIRM